MQNKKWIILIFIGILLITIFSLINNVNAESYSSYENRCLDWGNKYSYTALRDVTFSTAGMNFGQIFRCNKTVGINVIGINIQACSVWSPKVLSYSIRNVSSTTGYPTNYINTSKNNFIPVAGWNKLTFAEKIILTENNYYSLEFRDYNNVMTRTMYVTIRLGDDGRSNIFGRSPSGAYEPMDRSYRRTSFISPCYTDGSMPWYISHYYGVNLYRNNSGNIYSGFFANSVFGGTMIRQTFKPTENMYVKSITANVIPYEVLDYIPNDDLTVCLFNESSGLYLVNATLINKKEPCLIPYDSAIYNVYRPYTVELNANKYLSSSYVYSIRFRSWGSDANSGYIVQTMISTVEVYFKPLTFQGLTRNTSYNFNNGSWIYNSNLTDIVFTLNQVNSSWIAITTTPFTYHNNTVNVSSVKQLKLLSDGYHLWDNSSSAIMSYTTFVNCTGTLQKAWYPTLGKFKVWANVTGTKTPFTYHNNTVNVSSIKQLKLLSDGYHLWDNSSSGVSTYEDILVGIIGTHDKAWYPTLGKFKVWANYTLPINYCGNTYIDFRENLVNCTGNITSYYDHYLGWIVYYNYTGNKTTCGSTNLTVNELLTNCHGNYTTFYNPLTGWVVNNTYIGNTAFTNFKIKINITNLSGYVKWSGTHIFNTTNITFNATGNTTEIGNVTINTDDYFLSGILTFENTQFFLLILIGLWCFFIVEYYNHKELMFAYVQLLFSFPLTLYLGGITFFSGQLMILPLLFIIPILSLYIVIDGYFYRTNKKV